MALTLIAAVLVGAAAPFVRAWIWGVPFGLLSIATVLRSFLGSLLTTLVIGVVAFFALRATTIDPAEISRLAASIGGLVAVLLLIVSARRLRDVRGLSILCQRLQEDDARSQAATALDRLLARQRRRDEQRHVALVLMATGPLTQAGMWAKAREQLQGLDEIPLSEPQAVLRDQALATCELQFDDPEAAQRAIDRIRRPTEDSIEVWLVAMEALLMAVRGESEKALAHLGGQNTDDNPSLRASHRLVHAHILAKRGRTEDALEELRLLQREAGSAGLERVVLPRGPASPLAERLLNETDQSD
ncbi:MAG: magnesium transporter [Myxococcales bacterium]|nr:magnesium transporter [Myxococcales bacterium]